MISDVSCEAPVINAVLEKVGQRHCGMREAMNEDRFQKSFCVMDAPTSGGDAKVHKCWVIKFGKRED